MSELTPVLIPQLNPNERESLLVDLRVQNGQNINTGEVLAVLETTKSTMELTADSSGYVLGLVFKQGDTVSAGQMLCYLGSSLDIPLPAAPQAIGTAADDLPAGLRITQPALALARALSVDLNSLPLNTFVTEAVVHRFAPAPVTLPVLDIDEKSLIIYGGGGHGKSLVDLVRLQNTFRVIGIVDDGLPVGSSVLDVPVLGGVAVLPALRDRGVSLAVNAVGGIGNLAPRLKVFENLKQAGFDFPTVIHPRAVVEASAEIAAGVQVFAQAYVGSAVRVGFGCIVNTGAILSHDCVLGEMVNISPGAILAGSVQVGARTLIGMGGTVNLEVNIGAGTRIGNGATVKADVPAGGVVRAGSIWPE
ncbi:MAG TPA: NeuD/PglB/VioB family sugar acetyltransferase [Bellilinea sp.]|nr:NeuD/PglB/VioB family sugar acetyltransferase [Bellilinea sp.]